MGHAQLETGYTFTRREQGGDVTERHNLPEVLLRYRPVEGLETRLLWNGYAWSRAEDGGDVERDAGGTDVALGVVVPLVEPADAVPAVALELLSTVGTGSPDFSTRDPDPTAKLLWSYAGGPLPAWLGLGGNLVAAWPTAADGERFAQTAASLYATVTPGGGDTTWFAEWYVVSPYAEHTGAAQNVDVGVVQRLTPRTAVDARVGLGLGGDADDVFAGVGFSILF